MREISFDGEVRKRRKREVDETKQYKRITKQKFEPQDAQEIEAHNEQLIQDVHALGRVLNEVKDREVHGKVIELFVDTMLKNKKLYIGNDYSWRLMVESFKEEEKNKGLEAAEPQSSEKIKSHKRETSSQLKNLEKADDMEESDTEKPGETSENVKINKKSFELIETDVFNEIQEARDRTLDGIIEKLKDGDIPLTEGESELISKIKRDLNGFKKEGIELDEEWLHLEKSIKEVDAQFENVKKKEQNNVANGEGKEGTSAEIKENLEDPEKVENNNKQIVINEKGKLKSKSTEIDKTYELGMDGVKKDEYKEFKVKNSDLSEAKNWGELTNMKEYFNDFCSILPDPEKISEFKKHPYGIWIPSEIIEEKKLSPLLRKYGFFMEYSLKNPELGKFLQQIQANLELNNRNFSKIIKLDPSDYSKVIKNRRGIIIKNILYFHEHPLIKNRFTEKQVDNIKKQFESFLTDKNSIISWSRMKLNFHPDNLERVQFDDADYVILPTSNWETKEKRYQISKWAKFFWEQNKSPPKISDFKKKFKGYHTYLGNKNITHNSILKSLELPVNVEYCYDWSNPKDWEVAKEWAQGFYIGTFFFGSIFGKEGRSPTRREIGMKFGGLDKHLRRKGVPTVAGEIKINTHNELLRFWELPLNREITYDWSDPKLWEIVRDWTQGFYISISFFSSFSGEKGRSPTVKEISSQFGKGLYNFLHDKGYFDVKKNISISSHNELMQFWNLPITELEKVNKEGKVFDKIGKECLNLKLLFANAVIEHAVYHPSLKNSGKKFVIPDGIIHDFNENPIMKKGKKIFLKKIQRIDKFVDFKRNFGSMERKDWDLYTKLAKTMDIFLLHGVKKIYRKNGCKITFHPINKFISMLRNKISPLNKSGVELIIRKIELLKRGIIDKAQINLYNFTQKKEKPMLSLM